MLNHKGTNNLETERLILRRFVEGDAEPMFYNWASREEVTKYVTWFPHKSVEETQQIVNLWVEEYSENNRYQWAIVLKSTNEPIGSIGVVRQNEDVLCIDLCIRLEEVLCGWVISLSALDDLICAKLTEGSRESCAVGDGNNSMLLTRHIIFVLLCFFFG